MNSDLVYQLALCDVPHIGTIQAKILCEYFESASKIFQAKISELQRIEGIGEIRARSIKNFSSFNKAEKEISFLTKYNIEPLFFRSEKYPRRLLNCFDPPVLLFYKGNADLNAAKIISVVGTRRNSEYGKTVVDKLVVKLAEYDVVIVSGLAFGIDALAHQAAIKNGLPTIGVIAHGLDIIYPSQNARLAKEMLALGGVITEFRSNTKPDKFNFPSRNRIVAGMSDATVIIESGEKGGSIITADIADSYHRDVFAVPGRITDNRSKGCNLLIKNNKAILLSDPDQLAESLGWKLQKTNINPQRRLFTDVNHNEQQLITLLQSSEWLTVEELNNKCTMPASVLVSTLLSLELKNIVEILPGKRYKLLL